MVLNKDIIGQYGHLGQSGWLFFVELLLRTTHYGNGFTKTLFLVLTRIQRSTNGCFHHQKSFKKVERIWEH